MIMNFGNKTNDFTIQFQTSFDKLEIFDKFEKKKLD